MAFFQKVLSNTDVSKQMAVDSNFMRHLPQSNGGRTVPIPVRDENSGKTYAFGYYVRRDGHKKPVFQGRWHPYRREKDLQAGDRITFWADGGGSFRILAEKRVIKLLGTEVWNPV